MGSVTLGGDRLGSGNKQKLWLHNYERSTHDLSYVWRSTMAPGTLVPFLNELALPGDTFDINLDIDIMTHPTTGPLFGSYKVQLDVFQVPIRLYQGMLHMNMLGIGMAMSKVKLPQIVFKTPPVNANEDVDNQHTNPSSIFAYLDIRGAGFNAISTQGATRQFNAVPYLAYWDIYKSYYANKQEEIGAIIHKDPEATIYSLSSGTFMPDVVSIPLTDTTPVDHILESGDYLVISAANMEEATFVPSQVKVKCTSNTSQVATFSLTQLFNTYTWVSGSLHFSQANATGIKQVKWTNLRYENISSGAYDPIAPPIVETFPLENIDLMRQDILSWTDPTPFLIDATSRAPYGTPLTEGGDGTKCGHYSKWYAQEGLALKTYNSDLFNNWISTEWIDGVDGISAITAIDTSEGSFTIDELNLSKKIYDMLNRIAVSGGTYDDWLDAVYTHNRQRNAENPMYIGGLMTTLIFQEVISNAETEGKPLGTLAGRGKLGQGRKGGHIVAKVDEPSILIGLVSLTPRVDYSQGNKWHMNLKTLDDLHKPALDAIGFQDLITDQMAWFDTRCTTGNVVSFNSAGKQPAWANYMTNVNTVRGNFADVNQQMWMTLNRRYESGDGTIPVLYDLTTYIDPMKFNHIFADTRRDAQNFWTQIGVNMLARRKMSAKIMPNL